MTSQANIDEVVAMINTNRASTEGYLNVSSCATNDTVLVLTHDPI